MIALVLGRHLLPPSILDSQAYAVLLTFVSINTVMYAALSVAKILPKLHPGEWISRLNRRTESRSIYPDR